MSDNDYNGVASGVRRLSARQWEMDGAPTDGVTLVGIAPKGSEITDTTTGTHYYHTGTLGAPVWSPVLT